MSTSPNRVFITGLGMLSPMGQDESSHLTSLKNGTTHFREIDFFDVSRQRLQSAGVAPVPTSFSETSLSPRQQTRLDRGAQILLHTTQQALQNASINTVPENTPFIVGTSAGAMPFGEEFFKAATASPLVRKGQFQRVEHYQVQRQVGSTLEALNLGESCHTQIISNACASGANAIGHAFHKLRSGQSHLALAGGYDALCQLVFAGFDSLQALALSGIPRPFDAARDGLALGEGGAMMILETETSMEKRNATPIAEVTGYGISTDLHHLTQPNPEGLAAIGSMSAAARQADIPAAQIQYINSHGTGTPLNDIAEANAITTWAGEAAKDISVSSTKSAMGHLLGGAGAIESAICLLALKHGLLPASLNIREPDPACQFDLVREPRAKDLHTVLTNSFGFGGSNASLIFQK